MASVANTFDTIVVGAGLIGAAAVRHLSLSHQEDQRIAIIGPEEPSGWEGHTGVFGSHYDQGRITRVLDDDLVWATLAKRSMEIAAEYTSRREGFGMKLADRESVQIKMGDLAHDIQIGRLLVMHAAWKLDQGDFARNEVSMAKVAVSELLHKAVDTSIQLLGATGYSRDTKLDWIYRYARQARLVDGASEVHKMVLSRFLLQEGQDFWKWG